MSFKIPGKMYKSKDADVGDFQTLPDTRNFNLVELLIVVSIQLICKLVCSCAGDEFGAIF